LGDINFTPTNGEFQVLTAGVYKITFSITATQANQFDIRVNNQTTGIGDLVFGAAGGQPNVGTAIVTLAAGDVVTLQNWSSTGEDTAHDGLAVGDVVLPTKTGGTANSFNASFVIEQLNSAAG
jgi:hypothetical protein